MKTTPIVRMQRSRFVGILLPCLAALFPWNSAFSGENESLGVYAHLPVIQTLQVDSSLLFPEIGPADFDRGFVIEERAAVLTISSNVPWKITIAANEHNLYRNNGKYKPVSDVQWRTQGEAFVPLSKKPVIVAVEQGCVKDYQITVDYRLLVSWTRDTPGAWDISPEFALSPLEQSIEKMDGLFYGSILSERTLTFPEPAAHDLDVGFVDFQGDVYGATRALRTDEQGNDDWGSSLVADMAFFSPGDLGKPWSDLLWKWEWEPETAFRPLDMGRSFTVSSGENDPGRAERDFRLKLDWFDPPADYSIQMRLVMDKETSGMNLKKHGREVRSVRTTERSSCRGEGSQKGRE